MKSEGWPGVGFFPHVDNIGVFGINLNTLYSIFLSLKEVFSATNKAISLYGLYRPHLAIEFENEILGEAPGIRKAELECYKHLIGKY